MPSIQIGKTKQNVKIISRLIANAFYSELCCFYFKYEVSFTDNLSILKLIQLIDCQSQLKSINVLSMTRFLLMLRTYLKTTVLMSMEIISKMESLCLPAVTVLSKLEIVVLLLPGILWFVPPRFLQPASRFVQHPSRFIPESAILISLNPLISNRTILADSFIVSAILMSFTSLKLWKLFLADSFTLSAIVKRKSSPSQV